MRGFLLNLIFGLLSRLPLSVNHALGGAVGWIAWKTGGKQRRVSNINIGRCLPELSAARQAQLLRRSMIETGKALTEVARLWRLSKRPERVRRLLAGETGREHLDRAIAEGRGVIMLSPHIGAWEYIGLIQSLSTPMTILYRPPRVAELEAIMTTGRSSTGAVLVPTDTSGVKSLMQALRQRQMIGILPDQEPNAGTGVFAPFFGHAAYTMTLVSRLAGKQGVPVVLAAAERLPHGRGYRMHYRPVPASVGDGDTLIATTTLNAAVEAIVRELPEQYVWSYERFEQRPAGEKSLYE